MPAARSFSTSSRRFSSALAMTSSGSSFTMALMSGFLVPPTFAIEATAATGSMQNFVTPTTSALKPSAKSVSVQLGTSDTIRAGGRSSSTRKPMSSAICVAPAISMLRLRRRIHAPANQAEARHHDQNPRDKKPVAEGQQHRQRDAKLLVIEGDLESLERQQREWNHAYSSKNKNEPKPFQRRLWPIHFGLRHLDLRLMIASSSRRSPGVSCSAPARSPGFDFAVEAAESSASFCGWDAAGGCG